LYPNKTRVFSIVACDPCPDNAGGAGGAQMLTKALESCRIGLPRTVGLYDRDDEGMKEYDDLDANFSEKHAPGFSYKQHKNGNVTAALLPENITGRDKFVRLRNLPIEYLFPESYVLQKKDRKGLEFEQEMRTTRVGNKNESSERTAEPEHRKVKGGKVYFAEKVVPTFPKEAFASFSVLFTAIEKMFEKLKAKIA